jgi:signal-transduction protein with cAMP-binding, CBS, and nucleotidyltransferase domain
MLRNSVFDYFDRFLILSKKARKKVDKTIQVKFYRKGTIVVTEGNKTQYMYIIKSGIARGFTPNSEEDVTLSLWGELDAFGDVISYIDRQKARKSYVMLEDSFLYLVDIEAFRGLFFKDIEIANLGRILVERFILISELQKRKNLNKTAYEKILNFLSEKPGMINRVKSKYIASYLNIRPETFSRIHKKILKSECSIVLPSPG